MLIICFRARLPPGDGAGIVGMMEAPRDVVREDWVGTLGRR
jgi:hypothetical protein